jgi:hypothetical protein
MTARSPVRRLTALLPLALVLLLPGAASADSYSTSWDRGQLIVSANAEFTKATIENVSASFDECETATGEASCTWEVILTLHSDPERRCNPATPEDQVVWSSGPQSGNGTLADGSKSFPLEGCPGQNLLIRIEWHKTYDESGGPVIQTGGASQWALFPFGSHPIEEIERQIRDASPPATIPPPPIPTALVVAGDCRSLMIGNVVYLFSFRRIGCHKASNLAAMRHVSGGAPGGYHCRNGGAGGGVLCWRVGHPEKRLEWRLPGTKPVARPRS